ncbi:MAG: PEP-CTERM sorting domain-containing protein [Phycisphaeraceae bacterium]|nr:PEP-CTERM sorting domain-containing protein [Phycisphaeraceae bacterium]
MSKVLLASIAAVVGTVSSAAMGQIIYDNQVTLPGSGELGLVTHPGGGFGGADASALTSPDTTFGATANTATAFRLADDFTIPVGEVWTITGANVFGYTTVAGSPNLTAIGATLRIFSDDPNGAASGTVVAGDTTTNVQTAASWAGSNAGGIWRVTSTTLLTNNRRIQTSTSTFAPVVLGPGTYWLDFAITSSTGAVFTPVMSLANSSGVTGNARQFNGTTYVPLVDAGSTSAKGVPFQLIGTIVPAPSSLALLGLGGLVAARRRRS